MTWWSDEAWAEVVARGQDPSKPRRYRGKVLLEVRCEPAGHVLAYVYPTKHGPLLVPTVSGLPTRKSAPGSVRRRNLAAMQAVFGEKAIHPDDLGRDGRDAWTELYEDEDGGHAQVFIRGMMLVGAAEAHRRREAADDLEVHLDPEIDYSRMAHFLLCRCGQRYLYSRDLDAALAANVRSVTA